MPRPYRCVTCGAEAEIERGPVRYPRWVKCWKCGNGRLVWAMPDIAAGRKRRDRARRGFPTHGLMSKRHYPTVRRADA